MRRRRPPPFALVLSVLVAGAGLVVLLATGGGRPSTSTQPPTIGVGPSRACVGTRAAAQVAIRSAVVITATAQAPVKVTEQATGPVGTVTVTRGEILTSRVRVSEPVFVARRAVAAARACANANSSTAAHDTALREAYARALTIAHNTATAAARRALPAQTHALYPILLSQARSAAATRAHHLALSAEPSLDAQAKAQARARAGA